MKLRNLWMLLLTISVCISCNNKTEKKAKESKGAFELTGTIEGLSSGKVYLMDKATRWRDSANVENGQFIYRGDFPEPTMLMLSEEGTGYMIQVMAEDTKMNFTGKFGDRTSYKIQGGKGNADKARCSALISELHKKTNFRSIMMEKYNPNTPSKRAKEVEKLYNEIEMQRKDLELDFIKNNPKSYYSAYLVTIHAYGAAKSQIESLITLLDPSLKKCAMVKSLDAQIAKLGEVEATLEEFVKEASNVSYKVDNKYKGNSLKDVVYLGMFADNNLCALKSDGTILSVNPAGEKINEFKAMIKGQVGSIAIDKADNIYVMDVQQEMVEKKVRGKVHSFPSPIGVECTVYNKNGEKQKSFKCNEVLTASGARVLDGKLMLADNRGGIIAIYDAKTGDLVSKITDMRPCCGILDFSIDKNNHLLVANLGAFRVQSFDLSGKSLMEYGKRGKELEDFHGCCNPVSVASLNNGALVTVEKDPTRVKIFSKDGAKQIDGIQELVKGCSYIPMIVDAKDNLYLASGEKGLVKCIVKS